MMLNSQGISLIRRVVPFAILLCLACPAQAADEGAYEVHEWSIWVTAPNQDDLNGVDKNPTALPSLVESPRKLSITQGDDVAPVSVLSFRGEPTKSLDVGVRLTSGRFVAHWPKGQQSEKRLRWQELSLESAAGDASQLSYVSADHWFVKAREVEGLFLKLGARTERFLAYDAVLHATAPLELEGGPDRYVATNTGKYPLHDVLISQPTPEGRRVGWVDMLEPPKPVEAPAAAEVKDLAAKQTLRGHKGAVLCVAFAPSGNKVATGGEDGTIRIWDAATGQQQMTLEGHIGPVQTLAFVQDARLVSGGKDKSVRMWDAATGKQERSFDKHKSPVTAVAVSATQPMGLSGDEEGQVFRWNPATADTIANAVKAHSKSVVAIAESPNGQYIVTASIDRTAKIWMPRRFPQMGGSLKGHREPLTSVSCGRDNQTAVTGSGDGTVRQWNLAKRQEVAKLEIGGHVDALAYLPGTDRVAVGNSEPDKSGIWDVPGKQLVARLQGNAAGVAAVAPSSDGKLLAAAGRDGAVNLYDLAGDAASPGGVKPAGPPVEIVMTPALQPASDQLAVETVGNWKKRLLATGLDAKEVDLIAATYGKAIFESRELVAVCRLAPDTINDLVSLDVYPEPRKTVRVALLVIRKLDPTAKVEVAKMIKQLGDPKYAEREAAEKRLAELGSAAVPALRDALKDADLEIVFRAERLLAAQQLPGAPAAN